MMFKCALMVLMDTQAFDVMTFDYKGTHVCCVVGGYTHCQMNFVSVQNVGR